MFDVSPNEYEITIGSETSISKHLIQIPFTQGQLLQYEAKLCKIYTPADERDENSIPIESNIKSKTLMSLTFLMQAFNHVFICIKI